VARGQDRRGDRRGWRDGLGGHRRRWDGAAVRHVCRRVADPPRPREDARAEGKRWRESLRGPLHAVLAHAGRRDVAVPVCLKTDDFRWQPTQGAAPY